MALTGAQWAARIGVTVSTLAMRLRAGSPLDEGLTLSSNEAQRRGGQRAQAHRSPQVVVAR